MRMWMVPPQMMCRQHLLGEHLEIHMFCGSIKRKKMLSQFAKNNLFEPSALLDRHDALVLEMSHRHYQHKSPLVVPDYSYLPDFVKYSVVSLSKSYEELIKRCSTCRANALAMGYPSFKEMSL